MWGIGSTRTGSVVQPNCSRSSARARMEPMASPSGRAWAVMRKCGCWRKHSRSAAICASSIMRGLCLRACLGPGGGGFAALIALAHAAEKVIPAAGHLLRAVDGKAKFGDVADAHAVAQRGADEVARGHEGGEGLLLLFEAAMDGNEDTRGLTAGGE